MLLALHCTLRLMGKHGAFALPTGEAQQIRSAKYKVLRIFFLFAALCLLAEYKSQHQ
jgi:hypothetical protein